ncbi:MAG: hypothetical protein C4294_06045, partial [Nitrospiraceae bacterium]
AFSSNLVTMYLFYELISFATYPLVAHKETDEAFAKGNKYVFYLLMTSKALLLASFMVYALSGTFDFKANGVFPSDANRTFLTITYVLFLVGIGKAAIMPFHGCRHGRAHAGERVAARSRGRQYGDLLHPASDV